MVVQVVMVTMVLLQVVRHLINDGIINIICGACGGVGAGGSDCGNGIDVENRRVVVAAKLSVIVVEIVLVFVVVIVVKAV